MNLNVIVDVSGSMTENGKDSVTKYLLYAIDGVLKDIGLEAYKTYQWGEKLEELTETHKILFGSCKASDDLVDFLNNHMEEKNMIISDGGFSRDIKRGIKGLSDKNNIYYLGIGSDCDIAAIRAVAIQDKIYSAHEVIPCLKSIINEE